MMRASQLCAPSARGSGWGSSGGAKGTSICGNSTANACRAANAASRAVTTWAAHCARSACSTSWSRKAASPRATRRSIAACSRARSASCACMSSATMALRSHVIQASSKRRAVWCSASISRKAATACVLLPISRSSRALSGRRMARLSCTSHSL
ncbi:hypothetical protein SDC9_152689 [bioreactor metagenome]|uniref:Uncharacterized protein n=1 Tax=bioreactor metagenome TaxID=1076179 RepID=A0A645EW56_9ZZZZ